MSPKGVISAKWSNEIAYAVGLVASDGCVRRDGRHVVVTSADEELIDMYKKSLGVFNKTSTVYNRETQKVSYFYVNTAQKSWYDFLVRIGISPAKSKTISGVDIPDKYFIHFIRGLFDGDGTSYGFRDKRYPNAFNIYIEFATASLAFVEWLQRKMLALYGIKAITKKGKGVFILRLFKGDSRKLFSRMYQPKTALFLARKYAKMKRTFGDDDQMSLLRRRNAALA